MPKYSITAYCDQCKRPHTMGIIVEIPNGPTETKSIADTFKGQDIPHKLKTLLNEKIQCPITQTVFMQNETHKFFFVPVCEKN